jgi:hypothetical protein
VHNILPLAEKNRYWIMCRISKPGGSGGQGGGKSQDPLLRQLVEQCNEYLIGPAESDYIHLASGGDAYVGGSSHFQ